MSFTEDTRAALGGLAELVKNTDPTEKDQIVRAGSGLEKVLTVASSSFGGRKALKLGLQILQAVYRGNVADGPGALAIVGSAVETLDSFLAAGGGKNPELFERLEAELTAVLRDEESCEDDDDVVDDAPVTCDVSLNDVTARLLSLSATDDKAIAEIRALLGELADDQSLPESCCEQIAHAVGYIDEILSGEADDSESALGEAGEAVARAAEIAEDHAEAAFYGEDDVDVPELPADPTVEAQREAPVAEAPQVPVPAVKATPVPAAAPAPVVGMPAEAFLPQDADIELLGEYITECLDHITMSEGALLELETNPDDLEQIATVFRAFHTIKGSSGFLGLEHIQRLAHLAESMLDRGREGEIKITGGYSDLALKSCDTLKAMIEALSDVPPGGALMIPEEYADLLVQLTDPEAAGIGEAGKAEPMRVGDILVGQGRAEREAVEAALAKGGCKPVGRTLIEQKVANVSDVAQALRTQVQQGGGPSAAKQHETTVRVGTGRLDSLINMVGELVIAQSMVAQAPEILANSNPMLKRKVAHAGKIVRELQGLTMSLRMVPLKGTFQKMARLVRDLARKSNKSVQFVTEGDETEIDRNMVEVLSDPLVHMMRNAVDHGVESAEDRIAAGKSAKGIVTLRAYHAAGNVVIQIEDSGKGIDREKIIAKAVERGLVDSGKDMSDSEVFAMIFQPGFSTAEKITDVSGRGVGMDVVRKNIESIRGRTEIASTLGKGTTFTIRLPLTMAITDAMLVRVGRQRYLLPTVSIEQSFRPEPGAITTVTGRGEVVTLRGELLPVFRLSEMYGVADAGHDIYNALLIIIEGEGKRCALMVDELLGQQQVVIKSLGEGLKKIPGISGGAILGDGQVGLILDATGLLQLVQGVEALEAA